MKNFDDQTELKIEKIFLQIKAEFGSAKGACAPISLRVLDLGEYESLNFDIASGKCALVQNGKSDAVEHCWNVLNYNGERWIVDFGIQYQEKWTIEHEKPIECPLKQVEVYNEFEFICVGTELAYLKYSWKKQI